MNEWIPVDDEIPEEENDYLVYKLMPPNVVTFRDECMGWIEICYFGNGIFLDNTVDATAHVTHWMRLPEPPKERCPVKQKKSA